MGGKSRKSGGVSKRLILALKAGKGDKCIGGSKKVDDGKDTKTLFDDSGEKRD